MVNNSGNLLLSIMKAKFVCACSYPISAKKRYFNAASSVLPSCNRTTMNSGNTSRTGSFENVEDEKPSFDTRLAQRASPPLSVERDETWK